MRIKVSDVQIINCESRYNFLPYNIISVTKYGSQLWKKCTTKYYVPFHSFSHETA